MGLFSRSKSVEDQLEEQKEIDLNGKIFNLDRFAGGLEDYRDFKGTKNYVIMDTGRTEKFVVDMGEDCNDYELLRSLVKDGCVALINYHYFYDGVNEDYGTPVKRN